MGTAVKYLWHFTIPKGCRQACKVSGVSAHGDEHEVLLVPYTAIKVTGIVLNAWSTLHGTPLCLGMASPRRYASSAEAMGFVDARTLPAPALPGQDDRRSSTAKPGKGVFTMKLRAWRSPRRRRGRAASAAVGCSTRNVATPMRTIGTTAVTTTTAIEKERKLDATPKENVCNAAHSRNDWSRNNWSRRAIRQHENAIQVAQREKKMDGFDRCDDCSHRCASRGQD